jgi:MinD-like ATPase involved in chromosome partitioning or flagellar assembly
MAEIDFADGFDVQEPLAWGLTPAQLGTVLATAAVAYLVLHASVPRLLAIPSAILLVGAGLALALVRREGRTLIAWTVVAARFWTRPRRGLLVVDGAPAAAPGGTPARVGAGPREVETPRRVPLVVLPEPVGPPAEEPASHPARPFSIFSVADAALLEPAQARCDRRATAGIHLADAGELGTRGGPAALRTTRRLTFFSLGGGTGRTTLAVEVAALLARQEPGTSGWGPPRTAAVALVDLNLMSPRAGLRLGVPAATDWDLDGRGRVPSPVERLVAVHPSGLRVLPGPSRLLAPGAADDPELVRGVAAAIGELEGRGCATIVLDIPADLSALTRWALESAHDIFVVLTATAGGALDAYRSTEALRRLGLRHRLRYVVNRGCAGPAMAEAMLDLGTAIVAEIPEDADLERAEMDHRLLGRDGVGRTAAALRTLAATVDGRLLTPSRAEPAQVRRLLRRRAG